MATRAHFGARRLQIRCEALTDTEWSVANDGLYHLASLTADQCRPISSRGERIQVHVSGNRRDRSPERAASPKDELTPAKEPCLGEDFHGKRLVGNKARPIPGSEHPFFGEHQPETAVIVPSRVGAKDMLRFK